MPKWVDAKIELIELPNQASFQGYSFHSCEFLHVDQFRPGAKYKCCLFENCRFFDCSFPDPSDSRQWCVIQDSEFKKCYFKSCFSFGQIFRRCKLTDIRFAFPMQIFGAVFDRTELNGDIHSFQNTIVHHDDKRIFSKKKENYIAHYARVDWALDIRKANLMGTCLFNGVPGEKIKRNKSNSILVDCRKVRRGGWEHLDLKAANMRINLDVCRETEGFYDHTHKHRSLWDYEVFVIEDDHPDYDLAQTDFDILCRAGFAKR